MVSSKIQLKDMFWNPNIFFIDSGWGGDGCLAAIERKVQQMKKNKRFKIDTTRVSVTLPVLMVRDFRYKADLAGVSLSRIIYLQLRAKKPIAIVSDRFVQDVKCLRKLMEQVVATGGLDAEKVACLWQQIEYYEAWLPVIKGGTYVP